MADHAAHAHTAQELMKAVERETTGRLSQEQRPRAAHAEALLALAAAINERRSAVEPS
ncbi:hypothetical protein ACIRU3_03160 [Streptomyces sp. NPDC101151]|uniref:hypothetical protein n=1 Tax=Streptomyces sp. NPDC101151 TaxID=3366115 RepID=UPI00382AF7C2